MAVYAIYRYAFEHSKTLAPRLPMETEEPQLRYETDGELLESFFGQQGEPMTHIADLKETGRGKHKAQTWEPHISRIEQHRGHIIVMRLQANKRKRVDREDWKQETVGHHPDCRVIMDNRPSSRLLVIECKTSAFVPDKAKDLLEKSFCRMMHDYGVSVTFQPLVKQSHFWDAVNEIRDKFGDSVTKVAFDFKAPSARQEDGGGFIYELMRWASVFKESQLMMTVDDDKRLRDVKEDLSRMAELCDSHRDYQLTVKFRDFGLFRYGQDIKARYGLEDELVDRLVGIDAPLQAEAFSQVDKEAPMREMMEWFDKVNTLFREYEAPEDMVVKRHRGGRA